MRGGGASKLQVPRLLVRAADSSLGMTHMKRVLRSARDDTWEKEALFPMTPRTAQL